MIRVKKGDVVKIVSEEKAREISYQLYGTEEPAFKIIENARLLNVNLFNEVVTVLEVSEKEGVKVSKFNWIDTNLIDQDYICSTYGKEL